jgi:beta-alanine--pyruvate transaminase
VHERIAKHFAEHVLACGLTYYAHPTACAAALATLDVYRDEQLFEHAAALGPVLLRELHAVAARLAVRTFVRGLGLLAAIEIEGPADAWTVFGRELAARRLSLHLETRRATAIVSPPLCITEDELVGGIRALGDAAVAAFGAR